MQKLNALQGGSFLSIWLTFSFGYRGVALLSESRIAQSYCSLLSDERRTILLNASAPGLIELSHHHGVIYVGSKNKKSEAENTKYLGCKTWNT